MLRSPLTPYPPPASHSTNPAREQLKPGVVKTSSLHPYPFPTPLLITNVPQNASPCCRNSFPNRHPNSLPNDWHPLFLIYKLFSPFPHSFPCTCNFMPNSLEPCSPPFSICFSTRFGHYGRVLFKHLSPRVTNASKLKLNQLAPTRNSDDKSSTFSTKKCTAMQGADFIKLLSHALCGIL